MKLYKLGRSGRHVTVLSREPRTIVTANEGEILNTASGPLLREAGVSIIMLDPETAQQFVLHIPYEQLDNLRARLTRAQDALLRREGLGEDVEA